LAERYQEETISTSESFEEVKAYRNLDANQLQEKKQFAEKQLAKKKESDLLAYASIPYLEGLIDSQYRGGGIKLKQTPDLMQAYHKKLYFEWEKENATELHLLIYNATDNKTRNGKPIEMELPIAQGNFTLNSDFKDGLYYWQLIDDSGSVAVGKFVVGKMPK
jgi:hypothetical protein